MDLHERARDVAFVAEGLASRFFHSVLNNVIFRGARKFLLSSWSGEDGKCL